MMVPCDGGGPSHQVDDRKAVIVASYEHAYALVRAHGEAGWTARLMPLTVDGLIAQPAPAACPTARSASGCTCRTRPVTAHRAIMVSGIVVTIPAWPARTGSRRRPRASRCRWSGEWPRSANSARSVTAAECRYCFSVDLVMASGTVWSRPPMISSSGPRSALPVLTFAGECSEKLAPAASNSGLPGRRDRPLLVQRVRLLLADARCRSVPELLGGQRDGLVRVGGVLEDRQRRAQRGQRQRQHALDLRGVDRDRGRAEVLAEQLLGDHAAERVPDDDRPGRQLVDDVGVVRGDVVDAVVGDAVRVGAGQLDRVGDAGPARRDGRVARLR